MKTARPIRLGFIGCGRAVREHHLPAVSGLEVFQVEGVCDIQEESAREIAAKLKVSRRLTAWRDLLPQVEAVAVCTPPASHAEITVEALRRGLHVLLEKPMAMSLAECERILEAARVAGRVLLVAHNARWHPLIVRAREIVRQGTLGHIRAVHSVYTHAHPECGEHWHRRRSEGGGVLLNDAVHHFDLWRCLLGLEITEIRCLATDSSRFEDDTAVVVARLDDRVLAAATFSFSTTPQSEIQIFGTRASLWLDLYRFDGLRIRRAHHQPGSIRARLQDWWSSLRAVPSGIGRAVSGGIFQSSYRAMWLNFAGAIRQGAEPLCSGEDGQAAVRAVLMCRQPA